MGRRREAVRLGREHLKVPGPQLTAPPDRPDARWVDDPGELAEVLDALTEASVWCLDTEFHRERTYYPQLALLQVAWDDTSVLIDPLALDLAGLADVFATGATVVVHAASQDLEVLALACGAVPTKLFDTQVAAGFTGLSTPSLAVLLERFLHVRLPKADRLTDWLQRPLGPDARTYAAGDVDHLLEVHRLLVEDLERRGRLAWALDECEVLLHRPRGPRPPEDAWLRVKDSRQLKGRAAAVACSVAAWRERKAARLDQPVRFILSDLALVGIAQRPPKSVDGLRKMRGIDQRALRGDAPDEILAAVAEGLEAEPPELPERTHDMERDLRPAVALVSAWVAQLSRDLELDQTLLATRTDIEALLSGDETARLAHGWRAELAGEPVHRLVAGEAALAFDRSGGLVLEPRTRA